MTTPGPDTDAAVRLPAVAGTFYPADPARLGRMAAGMLAGATPQAGAGAGASAATPQAGAGTPLGILVPHAGLAYSGLVAAAGWRLVPDGATVVILGTNHTAAWLHGVGAWETGRWRTPLGDVAVDTGLASDILALGLPFGSDRAAHLGEHSIEVQLPLLLAAAPAARIVPLAVGPGPGPARSRQANAWERCSPGVGLPGRRSSSRSAPTWRTTRPRTRAPASRRRSCPRSWGCSPRSWHAAEEAVGRGAGAGAGMACGMCGIEPAVLGLAALRAMGATSGVALASATSADAGADPRRAVGYLAVAFGG